MRSNRLPVRVFDQRDQLFFGPILDDQRSIRRFALRQVQCLHIAVRNVFRQCDQLYGLHYGLQTVRQFMRQENVCRDQCFVQDQLQRRVYGQQYR